MVVQHCSNKIVGCADSMKITCKMQVYIFHRHYLRVAAACRAALYTENGTKRRLAERYHNIFVYFFKTIRKTYCRCRLTLSSRSRRYSRYEDQFSVFNIFSVVILVYFLGKKWRRYDGECFLFYLAWYGLGRAWIEGLRTDSLYLFVGSSIRVSQLVAAVCFVVAGGILLYNRFRPHDKNNLYVNRLKAQQEQAEETKED